jgi:predicted ATPase
MTFLRSVRLRQPPADDSRGYPFSVETIRSLPRLQLSSAVTFFAGGNGTGKSTLLEAIALGTDRVPVAGRGRSPVEHVREMADALTFEWNRGPRAGFFLRAEDFLEYKKSLVGEIEALERTAEGYAGRMAGYGLQLARGAALGQRDELVRRYGHDLDAMSHGESFLQFFRSRFTGPGLYLLDEPDTALSPLSVLGLLAALREMVVEAGAQFIIATHNPILLAYPGAMLLSFDRVPVAEVSWDDLEQVTLLREFLGRPQTYLRHLGFD